MAMYPTPQEGVEEFAANAAARRQGTGPDPQQQSATLARNRQLLVDALLPWQQAIMGTQSSTPPKQPYEQGGGSGPGGGGSTPSPGGLTPGGAGPQIHPPLYGGPTSGGGSVTGPFAGTGNPYLPRNRGEELAYGGMGRGRYPLP